MMCNYNQHDYFPWPSQVIQHGTWPWESKRLPEGATYAKINCHGHGTLGLAMARLRLLGFEDRSHVSNCTSWDLAK